MQVELLQNYLSEAGRLRSLFWTGFGLQTSPIFQQRKASVAEYVQFYNLEHITLKNGLAPFEIWSKAV